MLFSPVYSLHVPRIPLSYCLYLYPYGTCIRTPKRQTFQAIRVYLGNDYQHQSPIWNSVNQGEDQRKILNPRKEGATLRGMRKDDYLPSPAVSTSSHIITTTIIHSSISHTSTLTHITPVLSLPNSVFGPYDKAP